MITKRKGQSLLRMNTFRMDVSCGLYIEYDSVADLLDIDFGELPEPVLHIGGGSNLLFTGDFPGTVLHSAVKFIYELPEDDPLYGSAGEDEVLVSVGAGVAFDDFCLWAAEHGLWGAENLSHIPGETGAAAVQNVGAYGAEVSSLVRQVYCYDTLEEEFTSFSREDCRYGYRSSIFKEPEIRGRYVITHVVMSLSRSAGPQLEYGHIRSAVEGMAGDSAVTPLLMRDVITSVRRSKLPEVSETGSAGSFFKNPVVPEEVFRSVCKAAEDDVNGTGGCGKEGGCPVPHYITPDGVKIPAAWLIEQCGWKGVRCGNVAVYDRQPLVIVNATGKARPEEVIILKEKILASVKDKFGIDLSPEVEII